MTTLRRTWWAAALVTALAACGGGGSDPVDAGTEVPGIDVVITPDKGQPDPGPQDDGRLDTSGELASDGMVQEEIEAACIAGAGAEGCPCMSPNDCVSGLCIDTMEGQRCTIGCGSIDPCPQGWYCGVVAGSGSDVTYGCIDPFARLCQPCKQDQECVPTLASTGFRYLCVAYGVTGSFCGVSCEEDLDCPVAFECTDVVRDAGTVKQCRPAAGAECPCTAKFEQQHNLTECRVENTFGTCRADRSCSEACPAATPAAETCNAVDDDCNGQTDEGLVATDCTLESEWGTCPAKNNCVDGAIACTGRTPAQEACNGVDDNCDGTTDEENALNCLAYFRDEDKDAHGVDGDSKCQCGPTPPYRATVDGDCNDADVQVFTGATEVCNDKDDNCNGATDEEGAQGCIPYYSDQDGDTYGVTIDVKCLCKAQGLYTARLPGDCNDLNTGINPAATEVCNGKDDECDGVTDNPGAQNCTIYYLDSDRDKFGKTDTYKCLCTPQPPYDGTVGGDCNDDDKLVRPSAVEICNGKDDDCNGVTDDPGIAVGGKPYYKDLDGDGFGSGTDYQVRCESGNQYTSLRNDDCNDSDPNVYPGATEECNGKDDNCNGSIDEDGAVGCNRFYYDKDGDSYGLTGLVQCRCGGTASGFYRAAKDGDCNDNNILIRPGAAEICDEAFVDEDCDGQVNEEGGYGCTQYYIDVDADGFSPDPNNYKCLCTPASPYTATDATGDCCDRDPNVFPNQSAYFPSKNACGTWDYDCNTYEDFQYRSLVGCKGEFLSCGIAREGWTTTVPGCGGSGDWSTDCSGFIGIGCAGSGGDTRTQGCK